jgi:hypothetical protein
MPGCGSSSAPGSPTCPYRVAEWRRTHPGEPIGDRQVFVQPWVMGPKTDPRRRTIFYQYSADRARRTLKGIDQQITKAEKAVAGQAAVKRNRFVQLAGATKSINRELEAKARGLAGLKGYVNLEAPTAEYVMGAYHQLWQIEQSFRMSKTDLRAPAGLPSQAQLYRGPPHHRDGRSRGQPTDRTSHRLEHRPVRQDPPPLPHRHHPGWRAHPHRPRRATRDVEQVFASIRGIDRRH